MFMETLQGGGNAETAADVPVRRRIWEADAIFACPVVGMCLSIGEQRRLCRTVGAAERAKSDFVVHEMLVAAMRGDNPLSRRLDALLSRKYASAGRLLLAMPEQEFLAAWRRGLEDGECRTLLWVAAVRNLGHGAGIEIFGSLHMAVHSRAREFGRLTATVRSLGARAVRLQERNRGLKESVLALAETKAALESSLAQARRGASDVRRAAADNGRASVGEAAALREAVERLEFEALERESELDELRAKCLQREAELARLREEYDAHLSLDAAMRKACAGEACVGEACTPDCPSFSLCEKRVLIVGGIERMEKAYRKFIEGRGGIFEYHAGHMTSRKALESSVQRADVVLCPVNCNSHGACLMVKSLGKKYRKPVHMLSNFSISTLARTVETLPQPGL